MTPPIGRGLRRGATVALLGAMPRSTSSLATLLKRIPTMLGLKARDAAALYEPRGMLEGVVEIRRYAPATLVSTSSPGAHDRALRDGWRRLARFVEQRAAVGRLRMLPTLLHGEADAAPTDDDAEPDVAQIRAWTVAAYVTSDSPGPLQLEDSGHVRVVDSPERWVASFGYRSADTGQAREEGRSRLLASLSQHPEIRPVSAPYWVLTEGFERLASKTRNEAQIEIDPDHLPEGLANPEARSDSAGF